LGVAFALTSSLLWGFADFLGGGATRRANAIAVVAISNVAGLIALMAVVLATQKLNADGNFAFWAISGGFAGVFALSCFYAALAQGTMGVVAPIASLSVLIPVSVGIVSGERPGVLAIVGIVLAVSGLLLATAVDLGSSPSVRKRSVRPVLLAILSALGGGYWILALGRGGEANAIATLSVMKCTQVVVSMGIALGLRLLGGIRPQDLPLLAVIGIADAGATATFALASQTGLLISLVAVLGSLYPAVTVLMAHFITRERMTSIQLGAGLLMMAGVLVVVATRPQ
jgi:drug/metabolite transporter (DMT)-like permease